MMNAQGHTAGWQGAITRNRDALLRIVAALFFMAGLDEGGADAVPRRVWRRIMRLLRPAEAAIRRLIVIAARGIAVDLPKPRAARKPTAAAPKVAKPQAPAFPLADPPRRFDKLRWEGLRPFPQDGFELADADEEVDARPLCRRLVALKHALDDLDGQAMRLARRQARLASGLYHRKILRAGRPPGYCKRANQEIDDVLRECHSLALSALKAPNSS